MPRKTTENDDMPRRRRGTAAAAIEAGTERGLAMRMLLHSPKDMIAGLLAFAAVSAIVANALFLQAGRHPSPMFGTAVPVPAAVLAPASPLPRPRPVEATRVIEPTPADPRLVEARTDSKGEPRAADPMASLVKSTAAPATSSATVRPPAPIPASTRNDAAAVARRVAAVQRTLTEFGYAQLKPSGIVGSDTQAAIQKFERDRKLPVTGQMSDRLVRELAAMTGKAID